MKTGCIAHPANEPLIIIHRWQVEICDEDATAAALLSFFEYWHNIKCEMRGKAQRANDIAENHGDPRTQDESLFQFHTEEELVRGIMIAKRDSIRKAIKLLQDKNFISVHKNPNSRYAFDKTRYFLFHPEPIQDWMANRLLNNPLSMSKNQLRSSEDQLRSSENAPAITETTPEITPEITPHIQDAREKEKKQLPKLEPEQKLQSAQQETDDPTNQTELICLEPIILDPDQGSAAFGTLSQALTNGACFKAEQAMKSRASCKVPPYRNDLGVNGIKPEFLIWVCNVYLPTVPHYRKRIPDLGDAQTWITNKEKEKLHDIVSNRYQKMLDQEGIEPVSPQQQRAQQTFLKYTALLNSPKSGFLS